MSILGVKLKKPRPFDYAMSVFYAIAGALVGWFILVPLYNGSGNKVVALALSTMLTGMLAACGASFDKAGWRGLVLMLIASTVSYGICARLI